MDHSQDQGRMLVADDPGQESESATEFPELSSPVDVDKGRGLRLVVEVEEER